VPWLCPGSRKILAPPLRHRDNVRHSWHGVINACGEERIAQIELNRYRFSYSVLSTFHPRGIDLGISYQSISSSSSAGQDSILNRLRRPDVVLAASTFVQLEAREEN